MTINYLSDQKEQEVFDIIVVGGGINGAGIAADAAGRGLKVGLYEAQDFAGATSSASSKLIHGGLRYLEHYEFRLVSESLAEREVLLAKAPHIAFPMRFRLPHRPFLRPAWMIRAGLFLYDHLGKRTSLPSSKKIALDNKNVMKSELSVGFEYSDCWVDDARLVILNVIQARELGAEVSNYCQVTKATRENGIWHIEINDQRTGKKRTRKAKVLVNATGPWVKDFLTDTTQLPSPYGIRLIKGSHIIVPKLHGENQAYIMQNEDHRIVFVIPYLGQFSIIGTTDVEYHGDPRHVSISDEEKRYLLKVTNSHFRKQLTMEDIVSDYSGVRPLCDDESDSPQAITRDYTLSLDHSNGQAPLLSIFGGKLTTYRKLAEAALQRLSPYLDLKPTWTKSVPLPGGENFSWDTLEAKLAEQVPFVDQATRLRWIQAYGSRVENLLNGVKTKQDLGIMFTSDLYQIEIDYLVQQEFAANAEDILTRRSKLHLLCKEDSYDIIANYLETQECCTNKQCA
ncbi:glycerol-3-phosphate dehydrogenase [Vibrio zhanjiangensis]|uniref:Glycerol-3-phosphate dehydrogenase n=1 Tax=Vibrio zhanjiangensis TaxID=1046128 RepID=A0ABQ6F1U9_9VIBR|nr:glycerol-3-phosphate dehydrogenase [Vibrio zhanjiangensis]GLT19221.1 glycerol-3-phosphate dehydrogenase [Vibrio zhanjiangensis]